MTPRKTTYYVLTGTMVVCKIRDGHPSPMGGGEAQESNAIIAGLILEDCLGIDRARQLKEVFAHHLIGLMLEHNTRRANLHFFAHLFGGTETTDPPFEITGEQILTWAAAYKPRRVQLAVAI